MSEESAKRPWLAAVLAVLYPGLGHAYLELWGRAVIWSGAAAFVAVALVDVPILSAFQEGGLRAIGAALSPTARAGILAVTSLGTADAYWQARVGNYRRADGETCPECGKDVDQDLAFCHWCTARLDGVGE